MTRKEERIKAAEKSVLGYHPAIQKMCTECFIGGAEWADNTMIEKAVKYLSGLTRCAVSCIGEDVNVPILSKEQLEDFKKAMEE